MPKVSQSALCVLASLSFTLLVGCGGAPAIPEVDSAALEGNWSLFGPLPGLATTSASPVNALNGIAMSIVVTGNQITAAYSSQVSCGAFTTTSTSAALTGMIKSDGTFILTPVDLGGVQQYPILQVSGNVPAAPGDGWAGKYTFTPNPTACSQSFSGAFAATEIQPLTGTYTGSVSVAPEPSPSTTEPVSIAVVLTQGATISRTGTSAFFYDDIVVVGSVMIHGVSCLNSGTLKGVNDIPYTNLIGNFVALDFAMDDGSTLTLFGYEEDTTAKTLDVQFMSDTSGNCPFTAGSFKLAK